MAAMVINAITSLYKYSVASFECFISSCANPVSATPFIEREQGQTVIYALLHG